MRSGQVSFAAGRLSNRPVQRIFEHNADLSAANNIAALGVAFVNQPAIPEIACSLSGQLSLFKGR